MITSTAVVTRALSAQDVAVEAAGEEAARDRLTPRKESVGQCRRVRPCSMRTASTIEVKVPVAGRADLRIGKDDEYAWSDGFEAEFTF